jgi:hypothetical protein
MMMMMSVTIVSFLYAADHPYLFGSFRIPWSSSVHGPPCFQPLSDGKAGPGEATYLIAVFVPESFPMLRMSGKFISSRKRRDSGRPTI